MIELMKLRSLNQKNENGMKVKRGKKIELTEIIAILWWIYELWEITSGTGIPLFSLHLCV